MRQRGDLEFLADGLQDWIRGVDSDEAVSAAVTVLEVFVMLREVLRDKER